MDLFDGSFVEFSPYIAILGAIFAFIEKQLGYLRRLSVWLKNIRTPRVRGDLVIKPNPAEILRYGRPLAAPILIHEEEFRDRMYAYDEAIAWIQRYRLEIQNRRISAIMMVLVFQFAVIALFFILAMN